MEIFKAKIPPCKKFGLVIGFFIFGGCFPVVVNSVLNDDYTWEEGLTLTFEKPWFVAWGVFIGFSLFIVPVLVKTNFLKEEHQLSWLLLQKCLFPALCLMVSIIFDVYSLIYLPPSVWKVIQFFGLLFTTLLNDKSQMNTNSILLEWVSLFIIFMGVVIAGALTILEGKYFEEKNPTGVFFSVIFMIVGEIIKSGQYKIEESIFTQTKATPYEVIACEGAWGFFFITFIFFPLTMIPDPTTGTILYENTLESFTMMRYNWHLIMLWLFVIILAAFYNFFSTMIIEVSNSTSKTTLDAIMPLFVWILSVIAHYITESPLVGESITMRTIGEIIGYIICTIGVLVYNKIIKLPCITYVLQLDDMIPMDVRDNAPNADDLQLTGSDIIVNVHSDSEGIELRQLD